MKAFLIEWDTSTGKRAGNLNPNDENLRCNGWQNMDVIPAIELRIVEDGQIGRYETSNPGITILWNKEEINVAIDKNFPPSYSVEDNLIYEEQIKQEIQNGKVIINELSDDMTERLKEFKEIFGIKGIRKTNPLKV